MTRSNRLLWGRVWSQINVKQCSFIQHQRNSCSRLPLLFIDREIFRNIERPLIQSAFYGSQQEHQIRKQQKWLWVQRKVWIVKRIWSNTRPFAIRTQLTFSPQEMKPSILSPHLLISLNKNLTQMITVFHRESVERMLWWGWMGVQGGCKVDGWMESEAQVNKDKPGPIDMMKSSIK